jgi:hypothetical protein
MPARLDEFDMTILDRMETTAVHRAHAFRLHRNITTTTP